MNTAKRTESKQFDIPAGALLGSAAVDLDDLREYEYGSAGLNPRFDVRKTPEQTKAEEKNSNSVGFKSHISPVVILGCALLAVITAFVLLANAQLTQINAENDLLEKEYAQLSRENENLTAQYEIAFNCCVLEEYATQVLGMARPTKMQITALPEYSTDKTVILCENSGEDGFVAKTRSFILSLLEYMA